MATIPYVIDCANGSLLQSDFFKIVIEFLHTCIPYVRWLYTSAKYRHLSTGIERKYLVLFMAKIALYIFELILSFSRSSGCLNKYQGVFIDMFIVLTV